MNKEEVKDIWERYLQGEASDIEKQFVESWYNQIMDQQSYNADKLDWSDIESRIAEKLLPGLPVRKKQIPLLRYITTAAAAILLIAGTIFYLQSDKEKPMPKELVNKLIIPGGNKATLRFADGSIVQLSEQQSSIINKGDSSYYADGNLVAGGAYSSPSKETIHQLELRTPIGGQYQIILSDGTKVWLNASSSLTYPNSFSQSTERIVELDGEAYFEVAPNAIKPFIVKSKGQKVRVLGTHFNVNTYDDEPAIKTTLLEGKVVIELPSGETRDLVPDQQSLVKAGDPQIHVRQVEGPDAIDWKNGDFTFNNESIGTIMRKISRWYDVDVEFRGKIPSVNFGGVVSRSKNITEVLQILELTGAVHFEFEITKNVGKGRRIVVMP